MYCRRRRTRCTFSAVFTIWNHARTRGSARGPRQAPPLRAYDELHAIVGVPLAASDRGLPVTLDGSEDLLAALVLDDLATSWPSACTSSRSAASLIGKNMPLRAMTAGPRVVNAWIVCSGRCECYQTPVPLVVAARQQ